MPLSSNARGLPQLAIYAVATAILIVAAIGLVSVVERHWEAIKSVATSRVSWTMVGFASLAYAASLFTTAMAWPAIIEALGGRIPRGDGLAIGMAAQIGKYVPGSISHYLGRAAIAKRYGVSYRQSGSSTLVEVASAVIAGSLIGGFGLVSGGQMPVGLRLQPRMAVVCGIVTLVVLIAATFALKRWLPRVSGSIISVPVAWLCVSFGLAGVSLYLLISAFGGGITPLQAIGIYAIAWVAGFAVPGAPAGLGVREAVLVLMLGGFVGSAVAIVVAAAHRILTAIVDGLIALFGFGVLIVRHRSEASARG